MVQSCYEDKLEYSESEEDADESNIKPKGTTRGEKFSLVAVKKEKQDSESSDDDEFKRVVVDKTVVQAAITEKAKKFAIGRMNWVLQLNYVEPKEPALMAVATLRLLNDREKDYFYFKARYFSTALQILLASAIKYDSIGDIIESAFYLPMRKEPHGANEVMLSGNTNYETEVLCFKLVKYGLTTYSDQMEKLAHRLTRMLSCDAFFDIYQQVLKNNGSGGKMAQDLSDKNFEMWKCLKNSRKTPIAIKYYSALDAVFLDKHIAALLKEMYDGSHASKFFTRPEVLLTGWKSGVKPKNIY